MNQATTDFINEHADDDVRQLALRGTKNPDLDLTFALEQIAGRQAARRKLPTWAATTGIVYPPHLSMEQCSSEQTARYKAKLAGRGKRIVDLTGGFGVDFSFMAQGFSHAVYVERQANLCEIARQNFEVLGLVQAEVVCADSTDFLLTMNHADVVYIDPARRDNHGGRTYSISDCTPDVIALKQLLMEKADQVIIKLSPMLDWRKAISDLGESHVQEVHIVSVGNECKELLLVMSGAGCRVNGDYTIHCVNLTGEGEQHFEFSPQTSLHTPFSTLQAPQYLYEPNASIMKAGCFAEVAQRFGISQIAQNSHLFVSKERVESFPGREFLIDAITTMNKRELKQHLQGISQANITVRNFPLTVAELRRRLKLSEGGSTYLFATTLASDDRVLICCRKVV